MTRKLLFMFSMALISLRPAAQTLPENYYQRLDKNCEKAGFIKRAGFFAGRMTANVLFKQGKNEIYKKEQSWNLAELSVEIANLSLVYNETDVNSGKVFSTEFKAIIDYLPNWKRNLKLARPNSMIGGYTLESLELDRDLENNINQKILTIVDELNKYYLNSMTLINESKENRNNPIVQDFQSRYLNHFSTLEEKSREFKNQLDEIFVLIKQFQKDVYDAEKILVSQKEQKEQESAKLAADNRKKQIERVVKYLENANFSIPYTVQLTKYTKECKYCGLQCENRETKVNEPNCDKNICRDAWLELIGLNNLMAKYYAESTVGGIFGNCSDSDCTERSGHANHVWHQINKEQVLENWLYTSKGVFKN